jgi:hypothetical protein
MGLRVFLDGVLCFKVRVGVGVRVFLDGVLCFKVRVGVGVRVFLDGVLSFKARVGVFLDGDIKSAPSETLLKDIFYSYI